MGLGFGASRQVIFLRAAAIVFTSAVLGLLSFHKNSAEFKLPIPLSGIDLNLS